MGQQSAQFIKGLTISIHNADIHVNRCQQFMIGIDGSRDHMEKALLVIVQKLKAAPNKTFGELAKTDNDLKKAGANYEHAEQELDAYKTKFATTIQEATASLNQAAIMIHNFQGFCMQKAKTWNPLKKKSLGKSLAAIEKAGVDLSNLQTFLRGMVEVQKAKGNFA
jgi:hypothetical protein